jgi:hypothetical protein
LQENAEWELVGVPAVRNIIKYGFAISFYDYILKTTIAEQQYFFRGFGFSSPKMMRLLAVPVTQHRKKQKTCKMPFYSRYVCCPEEYIGQISFLKLIFCSHTKACCLVKNSCTVLK